MNFTQIKPCLDSAACAYLKYNQCDTVLYLSDPYLTIWWAYQMGIISIVKKYKHKYPYHFNAIKHVFREQYRHLIPAPVDRTFASAWLYKHQWIECPKNKPSTSTANAALYQIHVQLWGHLRFHAQKTWWRSGMRSCTKPGLPTHLVQELNDGTVGR